MSALALVSQQGEKSGILIRKSIVDAFNRSAQGLKPQLPHEIPDLLLAEGYRAQSFLKKLGTILEEKFPGSEFEIGPDKDLDRAKRKMEDKSRPISQNCDFSRARLFTNVEQMKDMINRFGQRGEVKLNHNGEDIIVHVVDADNTFTYPNEQKPGLRNLDIKILVPLRLKNGEETYHVCELQFILADMRKAWDISHGHAETVRLQTERMESLQTAMEELEEDDHEAFISLQEQWDDAVAKRFEASRQREKINVISARQSGADELIGHGIGGQACNNNNPQNVAASAQTSYINLVRN